MLTRQTGNQSQGLAAGLLKWAMGMMGAGGESRKEVPCLAGVLLGSAGLGPLGNAQQAAPASFMLRGPWGGPGARPGCGSDTSRYEL